MSLFHKHLVLTAKLKTPPRTAEHVDRWLTELVAKVDMDILFGPHVSRCDIEGNEGVTGVVCITTSHCSIHVWDTITEPFMKFDLYSCKDFKIDTVIEHMMPFEPYALDYLVLDRNARLHVAATGYIEEIGGKSVDDTVDMDSHT